MQYILMNKDESWASFSCVQDEFGEESAVLNSGTPICARSVCNR